ncbi:hypothetical protein [Corynebacterium mayonis]|uniref:hypothetical protein n=1 Tax=Corynebacterium mayonis TaxID=3062461 RepID=UPI003140A247
MPVPNPFEPIFDSKQFLTERFIELIPGFREEQDKDNYVNHAVAAVEMTDRKMRRDIIAALRPYAEQLHWGPISRGAFGMLNQLGAKDLDVTAVVDEFEKYKEYPANKTKTLFSGRTGSLQRNVHPRNFEQFNRFLKMQSSRRPDPLLKSQQGLIWDGVGTSKKFREHPGFAWLVHSRFAGTAPEVDKALERIAKAQGLE